MAWSCSALFFDPSQHISDWRTPLCFTRYCQWRRNVIASFFNVLRDLGSPNIPWCMNWSICFISSANHWSKVFNFCSLLQVKFPSCCTSGVIASKPRVLIINLIISVGIASSDMSISSLSFQVRRRDAIAPISSIVSICSCSSQSAGVGAKFSRYCRSKIWFAAARFAPLFWRFYALVQYFRRISFFFFNFIGSDFGSDVGFDIDFNFGFGFGIKSIFSLFDNSEYNFFLFDSILSL